MLLKGVQEVEAAPDRRAAAEMILIRLCHVADMPPPGELLRRITEGGRLSGPGAMVQAAPSGGGGGARAVANGNGADDDGRRTARHHLQRCRGAGFGPARCDALCASAPVGASGALRAAGDRDAAGAACAARPRAKTRARCWRRRPTGAGPSLCPTRKARRPSTRRKVPPQMRRVQSAIDHPLVQAILETFPGAKIEAQAPPLEDEPELAGRLGGPDAAGRTLRRR